MSKAVYVSDGVRIPYTPTTADVEEGAVVVLGDWVGVATQPIKRNAAGTIQIAGVFRFPKASGSALDIGTKVYWDATNRVVTATAGSNKYIGRTVEAAAAADTVVLVKIES